MPNILDHVRSLEGRFDLDAYRRVVGWANAFKEGDAAIGVAAPDEASRALARELLAVTTVGDVHDHPLHEDEVQRAAWDAVDPAALERVRGWTLGDLATFLRDGPEAEIPGLARGLSSDVIACVVRLLSDEELRTVGARVFHPLPGRDIGSRGFLGARIQPNSPTDDPEDIVWQVFDAFAYAVGDVLAGTNPVDSRPESVAAVEHALQDVIRAFGLEDVLPHCVLAHIDVQAEVERAHPGSTVLWFQSVAGTESANRTFGISTEGMLEHARSRTGPFGLYLETGQGADFTNGHAHGFDMVAHESRKYGLARALRRAIAEAHPDGRAWLHVNDVAGFIGPEVFRTREQLVRCCLEDIVMGKLHGLTIGLDVCSTLHMGVTPSDLDWCLDRIVPASPAYLMALPTKNDPMLSYLTTGYHDHVRLRERFGTRVDGAMWEFFRRLGVVDDEGRPTERFGDPNHVFLRYRRAKGDTRSDDAILAEGRERMAAVASRGVPLAVGHGAHPWEPPRALADEVDRLFADAKESLRTELPEDFLEELPHAVVLSTRSADREDYIAHPVTGESLAAASERALTALAAGRAALPDVQIVVSDGLNARALTDDGHLLPYLTVVRARLVADGWDVARELVVLRNGRVRAGYRCGELLLRDGRDPTARHAVLHVIGERPGSGHHSFSAYLTVATVSDWSAPRTVDHDATRVVSGISDTALAPAIAAEHTATLLERMFGRVPAG